jgi:hypothetical protein
MAEPEELLPPSTFDEIERGIFPAQEAEPDAEQRPRKPITRQSSADSGVSRRSGRSKKPDEVDHILQILLSESTLDRRKEQDHCTRLLRIALVREESREKILALRGRHAGQILDCLQRVSVAICLLRLSKQKC